MPENEPIEPKKEEEKKKPRLKNIKKVTERETHYSPEALADLVGCKVGEVAEIVDKSQAFNKHYSGSAVIYERI